MNVNPSSETLWSGESVPTRGLRYQDWKGLNATLCCAFWSDKATHRVSI